MYFQRKSHFCCALATYLLLDWNRGLTTELCFSLATSSIILQEGRWQAPFTLIVFQYILYSLNQGMREVHTHPFFHRTRGYPAKTYGQIQKQNSNNTVGVVWMHSSFGTQGTMLSICSKDNCAA